ncbi:M13 family metallopeptidase [Motilibacter aurantiacus]|uniref:M13 family metallopeptidase n=1 Tax=Motilibacter aurantiacus TaxID=2714955 RepID=UPI001407C274|nr:M13-type metalloendopeptidase [Motilibacter aurantiacus]NHC43771.1 peptidase M13 [Motilibacter aurantiacus]
MRTGIDTEHLVPSVRPQDDLFRHVNGKWLDEAEIPADRAFDGVFYHLRDAAEESLRAILEAAAASDAPAGSEQRKIGDLYASFLDAERAERLGAGPIAGDLARSLALPDRAALVRTLGELARGGVMGPFVMWVNTDARQSDRYVLYVGQAGLGLPDESYYRDDKFAEIREAYVLHVTRMLELAGVPDPKAAAQRVYELEARLAGSHWDRVSNRDAEKTYNKVDRAGLAALTPGFDWAAWADALGAPASLLDEVIVRQPSYLTSLAAALDEVPLEVWREWLAWRVVRAAAPYLSSAFSEESFAFYGTTLTGAPEERARWKRAVSFVEGAMGEAVGKLYVAEHFPPAAKSVMQGLVANLVEAYRQDITTLDWMSPETKARALDKLERFTPKIGYPDKWRDYSSLEVDREDLVGNLRRAEAYELERDLAKVGSPIDRTEWFMTPQTVNAYYNPGMNEIVFPAAILQPPFFDMEADDAVNYGAIGAVIGHEIGHGFDDQGSKYDGDGNLNDWWTDADRAAFEERTAKLIAQYDEFEPAQTPGHKVNGSLTVGENIGDLGGVTIAYKAYLLSLDGAEPPVLEGMTGHQRFFCSWAQAWRSKGRDAEVLRRLAIDPHSPGEFRCNGVVRNLEEFHAAFAVQPGDGLWLEPEERVRIW